MGSLRHADRPVPVDDAPRSKIDRASPDQVFLTACLVFFQRISAIIYFSCVTDISSYLLFEFSERFQPLIGSSRARLARHKATNRFFTSTILGWTDDLNFAMGIFNLISCWTRVQEPRFPFLLCCFFVNVSTETVVDVGAGASFSTEGSTSEKVLIRPWSM